MEEELEINLESQKSIHIHEASYYIIELLHFILCMGSSKNEMHINLNAFCSVYISNFKFQKEVQNCLFNIFDLPNDIIKTKVLKTL